MITPSSDLIPVYVPKERLEEVYGLLGTPPSPKVVAVPTTEEDLRLVEWSEERLRHLSESAQPPVRWLITRIALRAEKWVSFEALVDEYAQETSDPHAKGRMKGALSALTKYMSASGMTTWPMHARPDATTGKFAYLMSESMAQRVRAVWRIVDE